ncbi:hypothetical protein LCGC14_2679730 [marine sediment metagenome]|uniref:Uncharacterized protein n=1 Tax=marine sediment metagenome TaxID=412755 RepID=A0A0F8ZLQ1_9ZZZZ
MIREFWDYNWDTLAQPSPLRYVPMERATGTDAGSLEEPLWEARKWVTLDKAENLIDVCECWSPWGEGRCVGAEVKECKRALRDKES